MTIDDNQMTTLEAITLVVNRVMLELTEDDDLEWAAVHKLREEFNLLDLDTLKAFNLDRRPK